MRIGMIIDKAFPPDIRVEKEIAALRESHEIAVFSPAGEAEHEQVRQKRASLLRSRVQPMRWVTTWRQRRRMILQKALRRNTHGRWREILGWDDWRMQRTGLSPIWKSEIGRFIREFLPDVLHVHDFTLVPTAIEAARPYRIPVVADLHENLPAALRAYAIGSSGKRKKVFETKWNYSLMQSRERLWLPRCHAVIVVVPEAAVRLRDYGVPNDRIAVVSNTESAAWLTEQQIDQRILERYAGRWTALYAGAIGHHRGLEVLIDALPTVVQRYPKFLFLVVGARGRQGEDLLVRARRLRVEKFVDVVGWQPADRLPSYISASAIGTVPHRNLEHTNTTVPHKLFQYMLFSKPVLVSDCPPLKRIVNDTGAGRVFQADNPESAAQTLLSMMSDDEQLGVLARNAHNAALGEYAWKHDAERLNRLYSQIERECSHASRTKLPSVA